MNKKILGSLLGVLLIFLTVITLALTSLLQISPENSALQNSLFGFTQEGSHSRTFKVSGHQASSKRVMNGKLASLGWIVGRDCPGGIEAYSRTADINPDAALVGTGWINPLTGDLINGDSNNCMPNSRSMDNVVQLIHSKGGKAYLTITMATASGSWTGQQQSAYIEEASKNSSYINKIVNEVKRVSYDGVIMDLEGASADYPNIQQIFADYNKKLWDALKPLNKLYGIALLHKTSDHDEYYSLNGFENWSLLSKTADFMIVMAVDQSYYTPGPTVSIPWLKQLVAYAQDTMPEMLPHTIWELPLYGAKWYSTNDSDWSWDGGVNYQDAVDLIKQIPASQIDQAASNLNDPYSAHIVYTDSDGVKHTIWYHTAKNLKRIITEFQQVLRDTPQTRNSNLQIAVWYRANWEPTDLWRSLLPILPN